MASNNDFRVLLQAVLDSNSIGQDDINKIQKVISKYHLNLTADLDKASVIAEIKKIVPQLEAELKKMTGVDIQINDSALLKAFNQIEKQAESTTKKLNKIQHSLSVGDYDSQLKGFETALKKAGIEGTELDNKLSGVKTKLDELCKSATGTDIIPDKVLENARLFDVEVEKLKNSVKNINLDKSLIADDLRVNDTISKLNEQLRKNSAYSQNAKDKINEWLRELETGDVAEARLKQINSEARKLHAEMAKAGKIGLNWWDKFKQAIEKFGGWSIATTVLTKFVYEFKKGIDFAIELDDALTDVAYTSNVSAKQLEDLGDSAIDMAKDLKTSAKNILEAVKIYSTANATAEDILRKSQPAIMLSNVSGMSGSESSKTINTALNQFELEDTEENLMDIVDTYEYVASQLNYDFTEAIKELNEGIEASGSVAKNAGLDMQEYATMVGVAIEKTGQSGSTIGQAYKTLFSRITSASATEGTLEEDISNAEKSLRAVGVEVRDSADNFRDLTDILSDLGAVWDSLTNVQKAKVGYDIAGIRQLNVLNSLFGAWEQYSSIMVDIDERTGEALENQGVYAESVQGHLGELEATAQSVWNNLIESETIKSSIDLLAGLLNILDKTTSALGELGTIGLGAGIFAGWKNIGRPKMFGLVLKYADNYKCSLGY